MSDAASQPADEGSGVLPESIQAEPCSWGDNVIAITVYNKSRFSFSGCVQVFHKSWLHVLDWFGRMQFGQFDEFLLHSFQFWSCPHFNELVLDFLHIWNSHTLSFHPFRLACQNETDRLVAVLLKLVKEVRINDRLRLSGYWVSWLLALVKSAFDISKGRF